MKTRSSLWLARPRARQAGGDGRVYDVDEFIVLTITYDFDARIRSYELLAEEFEIPSDSAVATAEV